MFPDRPRILLSNDDGIRAAGFATLEAIAAELSDDVWAAAPATEQSGVSRKMTFTEPVHVDEENERRWAVHGSPSDAVLLGLHNLMDGERPDLMLSGVNRGQNLAEDVTVSGTVAAAIQASEHGVPAIALSQTLAKFTMTDTLSFDTARAHAPGVIRDLMAAGWPKDVVINVNFPPCRPEEVKGVHVTRQGQRDNWRIVTERRKDPRGRSYFWIGFDGALSNPDEGDDLHAIYNGYISVTPLRLELTAEDVLAGLSSEIGAAAQQS